MGPVPESRQLPSQASSWLFLSLKGFFSAEACSTAGRHSLEVRVTSSRPVPAGKGCERVDIALVSLSSWGAIWRHSFLRTSLKNFSPKCPHQQPIFYDIFVGFSSFCVLLSPLTCSAWDHHPGKLPWTQVLVSEFALGEATRRQTQLCVTSIWSLESPLALKFHAHLFGHL